jgi:uncharacterized protein
MGPWSRCLARGLVAGLVASVTSAAGSTESTAANEGGHTEPTPRTLRVTGEGRTSIAPDVAIVTVGVTALNASLAVATREANERAKRVIDVLRPAVAPADIQTAHYAVQVEFARTEKPDAEARIAGYRVDHGLRVKIRDLARVGTLLDAVVAAGANEVEGLSFQKDDASADESRARAEAVRAARTKAEEMAKAAGVQLGELLTLSEEVRATTPRPLAFRAMAVAASPTVPVEAGELEISAQVEAVYAIR